MNCEIKELNFCDTI